MDRAVEHFNQPFDHHRANPRMASGQNLSPQKHHAAGLFLGEGRTDSAGMASNEVGLELADLPLRNFLVGQFPEAGGDPIDDAMLREHLLNHTAGAAHFFDRFPRQANGSPIEDDLIKIGTFYILTGQIEGAHFEHYIGNVKGVQRGEKGRRANVQFPRSAFGKDEPLSLEYTNRLKFVWSLSGSGDRSPRRFYSHFSADDQLKLCILQFAENMLVLGDSLPVG